MSANTRFQPGIRLCEGIIEWGSILLVVFAPLAFGAVEIWAWAFLVAACFAIAVTDLRRRGLLTHLPSSSYSPAPPVSRPAAFYVFSAFGMLFLLEALVQLIPLPVSLIDYIRPDQSLAGKSVILTVRVAGQSWATFSLYPALTAAEAVKLAAYALLFMILLNYRPATGSRQAFVTRLVSAIVITGFVVSVIGILQKYSWQGKIYGLRPIRFGSPFGPFVNRNHFAGYIIMVIPLALGMLLSRQVRRPETDRPDIRTRLARSDPRRLLLGFMTFIMAAALFLSLSRGGIAAGLVSTVFFIGLARRYRLLSVRKTLPILGVAALGLAIFLLYLGSGPLVKRFATVVTGETEQDVRLTLWRDTVRIYRDFPVLGTGLGAFERIYPCYKSFIWRIPYTHAENDYFQAAAEMGTWGWGALAGFFLAFFWLVLAWKPPGRDGGAPALSRSRPRAWEISNRGLVAGSAAGVLALLLQSIVNFNFSIPANALLLTVLLSLTVSRVSQRG